ncbi:MAG: hypothetical protein N2037_03275, partial [Acidimicrobiales bacterium]|nr:hypothetical protein [Acidimicrobiales bacterium]
TVGPGLIGSPGRWIVDERDPEIGETAERAAQRFEQIVEHALEVELSSGRREQTVEEAKRHILVRIGIIVVGTVVLLAGLAMLPLPGPGMLVVALGLGLLALEVPFAARLLDRIKDRLPQDEQGKLPRSTIVMMVVMGVIATAASIAWVVLK